MKVFVAGATGVIGRRAVAELVAAGHDVTGVARSPEKAALLHSLGATPVTVDLFDAAAVREVVSGHDAVVNLATKIPPLTRMARPSAWEENSRIRREASRHLADAALAAGAAVYVQESLAFVYGDHGDEWIDEDEPLVDLPPTEPVLEAERQAARVTEGGGRGVVLRFGRFLAPDADHAEPTLRAARAGFYLEPGPQDVYLPSIHADDAARAVVAALDAPAGVYNVVDDPLTRRDHRETVGRIVGHRLLAPPRWALRLTGPSARAFAQSQRPSNERFRRATGWVPRYPDAAAAWAAVTEAIERPPAKLTGKVRLALWVLVFVGLSTGVQALFTPQTFYDDFPFGRAWVAADGPFNEHLLRDFGAMNLALALVAGAALWTRRRELVRTAAGAWLAYSVPHFVYHAFHLDLYDAADAVGNMVALAVTVLVPAALLFLRVHRSPERAASPGPAGTPPPGAPAGGSTDRADAAAAVGS